ncbi:hypothetical protein NUU61_005112 [Penicillium alfredii]|uniref:Glycoside hydrolase family 76 protein n=1 Tax=Penicillium alfredii TaxID=1506179 RepID=A0A9W9F8X8_9EURO|nr:uncharacterized protein NUU61_005112 [Penicillium alfredii]KAJ5095756.1 hypothetical protein NUU61_005112 [Penicillium alfredii]
MASRPSSWSFAGPSRSLYIILALYLVSFSAVANSLAHPPQRPLGEPSSTSARPVDAFDNSSGDAAFRDPDSQQSPIPPPTSTTLQNLLGALHVMQDKYFVLWLGAWPTSIDWTAAVLGTHVSAVLSSLTSSARLQNSSLAVLENTVNHFFSHTSTFYFGENAFSLRNQAYDDMLWVVLDWLENIKFQDLHSELHYTTPSNDTPGQPWHGTQFRNPAAHRARLFYELASVGWDKTLCGGGMIWNPNLIPYKNAITNELFISASIGMYLYFPGDPIDSPFLAYSQTAPAPRNLHNPAHLQAAMDGYTWLKNSHMTGPGGLYGDGFHISGWQSSSRPKSRKCDVLNTMVYTYNQGVILSGLRGLWLATWSQAYLEDGHELIEKVLKATGWPQTSSTVWAGLGRGGVLEEACDSRGDCSQDGQTFKGIFFHHLAEFCRSLRPHEERFLANNAGNPPPGQESWNTTYHGHLRRCHAYGSWIEHNARAALVTRDHDGKFACEQQLASLGAADYRNPPDELDASTVNVVPRDSNDRGRGRTVETQSGGVAVLRALHQWQTSDVLL